MSRRTGAVLLALAILASVGPSSPVVASQVAVRPVGPAAPATTTVAFAPTLTHPVAWGVGRRHGTWTTTAGPQVVELIDVDPAAPGISFETSGPAAGVNALATVRSQAARVSGDGHRVIAAINGDVWATDDASGTRAPGGLAVHLGELVTGSTASKPTLGFSPGGQPKLGDVSVRAAVMLPDGMTSLAIDGVNKTRRSGDLVLYSRRWGTSTHALAGGTEVVLTGAALPLRASGTWTAAVASVAPTGGNAAIPAGSLVLSAQGTEAVALAGLTTGSIVTVTTTITPGWEDVVEAVSGREWLVEGAWESIRPVSTLTTAAHPRTAVALRADGSLVLATVDGGRSGYSTGVTASDLAGLLLEQGAVQAIMLDGGGSTTALVRRPGDVEATLVNRPSDGRERGVDNALLVISSIPTGPLAGIVLGPGDTRVVVGETVAFQAGGQDAALNGVSLAGTPVTWSMTGNAGTLGSDGRFRAREPGDSTVTGTVGWLSASAIVTVEPDTYAPQASTPVTRLRRGATVDAGSVPVTVSWAAATDVGTGVAAYELRRRLDGGAWEGVALPTPTTRSISQGLPPERAVQYQVRATDRAGNIGAWRTGAAFHMRLASERSSAVRYTGTWTPRPSSVNLDGASKSSRAAGATASYTFTGSQVAWIAARGPTLGSARISIDGRVVATVSLNSSTQLPRRAMFTYAWSGAGRHRITIRVSGTAGHPRVDVDGFAVVDDASAYPVLVGAGDIASCSSSGDSATAALIDRIPGTVFAAGDTAYQSGTAAEFANCYRPTWGSFRWRTRPAPGNHEYLTTAADPYFAYFGSQAGTAGEGWYAYDVGTWRIYSLNSNCAAVGGCGPGSAQEAWLRADLAANPRACVAAIWHHPLFSSGVHGGTDETRPLWDALYQAGADLVINGHDHDYERFAPQGPDGIADPSTGIREFVVGTGGGGLRSFSTIRANSEARRAGVFGVLKLELKTTGYTWRFVPVAGSTWTDTGSASCH
jgi:hypothetical protein